MEVTPEIFAWLTSLNIINPFVPFSEDLLNDFQIPEKTVRLLLGGKYFDKMIQPLQDAYNVKVVDIKKMDKTAAAIKKIDGVDKVKYGESMVSRLVTVFNVIRKATYVTVVALVFVTAFLIANTIKITIFSRKREIDIMRLVGASNINIKIPFIFEGLILGVLGSIIPILVVTYGYTSLYNYFDGQMFNNFMTLVKPATLIFRVSFILI